MQIKGDTYSVWYDEQSVTIHCEGTLRLNGAEEYAPINKLLQYAAALGAPKLTLDLQRLVYLNSSGLNMFSMFVIKVRQRQTTQLCIVANREVSWQEKSLRNLQRLMPSLALSFSG